MDDKFKTFCIGFDEFNYNEIPKSDYVSNLFNNKKFNQIISFDIKNNFLKILDKVCDEPLADTSIIPMFFYVNLQEKTSQSLSRETVQMKFF